MDTNMKSDWEARESLHLQELEEARTRAAQMEKTMRWWSDCTANWREKWSKVRNERNKSREEVKLLQMKLEVAMKESNTYRRQKKSLEICNEKMRKELEHIHFLLLKHVGQWDSQIVDAIERVGTPTEGISIAEEDETMGKDSGIEEYILRDGPLTKHAVEMLNDGNTAEDTLSGISEISTDICNDELFRHRLAELQLKLDETAKTVVVERDEKQRLHKSIENLESDLMILKEKYEDLKVSKQETVRELLQMKDAHEDSISLIKADLLNETSSREDVDRRLADVRAQLERLQVENASEWGKRERLETEKLSLERENKKLRTELRDTLDRLERRIKSHPTADNELRSLHLELADKNKEINDLKLVHTKLKKTLTDRSTELNHSIRRIDQYEAEVKKLRLRIEELKKDLAVAEDEIDTNNNNTRKLQRSHDDLQEQIDGLHVQIQYLQNRLKRKKSILRIHRSSDEQTDDDLTSEF